MRIAWLLALAVLLAGCASDDTDTDTTSTSPVEQPPAALDPQAFNGTGTVPLAVGPVAQGGGGGEFTVDENATLIFAEWRWDDETQDINGALRSPEAGETGTAQNYDHMAEGGSPGSPDSPHSLTLSGADVIPGAWQISAFGNGVASQVDYTWAVTVFYAETEVPEGYSGFGGNGTL